jgi:VanZ family protein
MKRLLVVLFLLFGLNSYSQSLSNPLENIETDKMMHFAGSYIITDFSYHFFEKRTTKKKAILYSVLISIGVGVTKEIIDKNWGNGAENKDLVADGLGISFAVIAINF